MRLLSSLRLPPQPPKKGWGERADAELTALLGVGEGGGGGLRVHPTPLSRMEMGETLGALGVRAGARAGKAGWEGLVDERVG